MVGTVYKNIAKPVLFLGNPEMVHTSMVRFGELLGRSAKVKKVLSDYYSHKDHCLSQKVSGIYFSSPIGLAAGFDYEARLTQILAPLGFGFQTVGSITNQPYGGNPTPRLGRMPESKSLLVNKGFKNLGANETIDRLKNKEFPIPLGISVGRTNSLLMTTQKASIEDIVGSFTKFEEASIGNSYYELNISCPNLFGPVSFYPPKNLHELLSAVDELKIKKPLFVKMPISESDYDTAKMIEVITLHSPAGIIIGNLQKDRSLLSPTDQARIKNHKGGISGKPTFNRSNDLISLAYKNFGERLTIIGCGGVFSASDAYEKIIRGATLVELITGMVFEGPQLISDINKGLSEKLHENGFSNITEARGTLLKLS